MFYGTSPSSLSPLVPALLTKNCVLIWFYGLCAHCCLMLHSYGVCCCCCPWLASFDVACSKYQIHENKYLSDPLPRWLPNPVPNPALRRWHLPCNGFFWELVPVVWSSSYSTRAPALALASILSCLSSFELEALSVFKLPSATNSSPPSLSFVCQAWKCIHRNIHHNFVCRVDLQAFKLWEDRQGKRTYYGKLWNW